MAISTYDASVAVFLARLKALAGVLNAAEQNATERKIDPEVFLFARLAPDMYPLTRQVQLATDHAKGASSRLAGHEVPRFEDDEQTFDDLHARIGRTTDHLSTFTVQDFVGSEERNIELKLGGRQIAMPGQQYLLHFAMPNFYFHVTTAYDILRHNGVPLGKVTFISGGQQRA